MTGGPGPKPSHGPFGCVLEWGGEGDEELTNHIATLVLLATGRCNVGSDPEADGDAVVVVEGVDVEAAEDGEATAVVDIIADLDKARAQSREGEVGRVHLGVGNPEGWI